MPAKKKASKKAGDKAAIKFKPLGDRVVVKPLTAEELGTKTASGIIIPDTAQEKPEQGVVVAAGEGKYDNGSLVPMTVSVGERVLFSKYGFDTVKLDGVEYYVISESNILGIIK